MTPVRSLLIAWQFLTAIPLHRAHDPKPEELSGSLIWFPMVGMALGGILAGTAWLLTPLLARGVIDALLIGELVLLTRGLHQDGLADTLDGWAGGATPAQRLAIMRDGRIGAFGATGLIVVLGLRYAGLAALPLSDRLPLLICMPVMGRWAMVVGAVGVRYARPEGGLAEPFLHGLSIRTILLAAIVPALVLMWAVGPVGAAVALAMIALLARFLTVMGTRLCGGITGDMLGAANECAETAFVIAAPLLLAFR